MTHVRNDMHALLQLRPKIAKAPIAPPPRLSAPQNRGTKRKRRHSSEDASAMCQVGPAVLRRLHPVTTAAVHLGFDCFEPFDLDHNQAHDIIDDAVFEALLKLCWSGIIALIMLAPPCKEYLD